MTHPETRVKLVYARKFLLWAAMAAIVMSFGGLTSAYLVKKSNSNWLAFQLPNIFWVSTGVILFSSFTMYLYVRAIKNKQKKYESYIWTTAVLGIAFCLLQWNGFQQLEQSGVPILGSASNPAASFLGVIAGFHLLHVLGGVIALIITAVLSRNAAVEDKVNSVSLVGIYWHFVDVLWIYLFVFFNIV